MQAGPVSTPSQPAVQVSYNRRLAGFFLEPFLQVSTLFFGWLIWFYFAARRGQTPAKQLLDIRILDHATGAIASPRRVWLRDFLDKYIFSAVAGLLLPVLLGTAGAYIAPLYWLVSLSWVLWDPQRRALWDVTSGTVLVRASAHRVANAEPATPPEERLALIEALREEGLISDRDYLLKRRDILTALRQGERESGLS